MAPLNPSYALQNRQDHTAQTFRIADAALKTSPIAIGSTVAIGGVVPGFGNQLAVTGTTSMAVNVDTGLVNMPSSTAWQGMYTAPNTALYLVSVPASNATQWRSDYIVARQHDVANGDADNNWDIIDVPGAFSNSSPGTLPTIPPNSVVLAIVLVTPNMIVTNGAGTVVDARVYAPLPGVFWTTSSAKPALNVHEGTMWFETDTGQLGIIVNGTYKYCFLSSTGLVGGDTWHSITSLSNSWTFHSGGYLKYRRSLENELVLALQNLNPGTVADGTNIVGSGGFPTGYQPITTHRAPGFSDGIKVVGGNNEMSAIEIAPNGSLSIFGVSTGASRFDFYGRFPLDI